LVPKPKKFRYERKEIYTVEAVLSKVLFKSKLPKGASTKVNFDGDLVRMTSTMYQNFLVHGTKCVRCGVEGKFFAKERSPRDKSYHFNLYGFDENGRELMMTRDHIIPRSRGGSDHLSNLQPMCERCNSAKGNVLEEEILSVTAYCGDLQDSESLEAS